MCGAAQSKFFMEDLQKNSGLPISLNENGGLEFHPPLSPMKPARRTINDMREYLAVPSATFPGEFVYDMYRNICLPQDQSIFKNAGIRFDMTVFHPGLLGKEYCKTIGHFHPLKPGTNVRYPETYEVTLGRALFLMQKMDDPFAKVLEVYAIQVNEGQDVIFLPGFAHFLINTTENPMITSNWSAANFESEYEPVRKHHGAAYYVQRGLNGQPEFIPNKNYPSVPPLVHLRPKELPHFGLINNQPAYFTGQRSPDMLQFLINPELYLDQLSILKCYEIVA